MGEMLYRRMRKWTRKRRRRRRKNHSKKNCKLFRYCRTVFSVPFKFLLFFTFYSGMAASHPEI
jgi:hypothetical protein